jgi:hypothetical protein
MEAKIGVMTEVMMSLREVIHASMDLDSISMNQLTQTYPRGSIAVQF